MSETNYEFVGYLTVTGGTRYRVRDVARKSGLWLKLGERDADTNLLVQRHDPQSEVLVVEHRGQTLTLPLRQARVNVTGAAPVSVSAATMPTSATALPLQRMAEQIAQRRAAREQVPASVPAAIPAAGGAASPR